MNFNKHFEIKEGDHAFLGASKYHWLNYDEDRLVQVYTNLLAKERGTRLHAFAAECIRLKQKLPRSKKTLNMFVNDAIGYRMTPEQVLYYSKYCFGTADAISFQDNILRIHDYKSGAIPAHMEQLKIYAALFCLEYAINPKNIEIELRIYQLDTVIPEIPDPEEIMDICNKIVQFNKVIPRIESEEGMAS